MSVSSSHSFPCCPHHHGSSTTTKATKGVIGDPTCSICIAWHQIATTRKKLSLQEECLELDRQLFKAERKKHLRDSTIRTSQSAAAANTSTADIVMELEEEVREWQERLQKEQREHGGSKRKAKRELQEKEEQLQFTQSKYIQLQGEWAAKEQEWKIMKKQEAAGETSHESSRGVLDDTSDTATTTSSLRAELLSAQQQLLEQPQMCSKLETSTVHQISKVQEKHKASIKELQERYEGQIESLHRQLELSNNSHLMEQDQTMDVELLKESHDQEMRALEVSHKLQIDQQHKEYESQRFHLNSQIESMENAQVDYETRLEKIQMESSLALEELEMRLAEVSEKYEVEVIELKQDQFEHAKRLLEYETATNTETRNLQELVSQSKQQNEQLENHNVELQAHVQQLENDIVALQDANAASDHYLKKIINELEEEMNNMRETHNGVSDKMIQKVKELQSKDQSHLLEQLRVEADESKEDHAKEVGHYEDQIKNLHAERNVNLALIATLEGRIARFDDDIHAIHESHEKVANEFRREIRELEVSNKKYAASARERSGDIKEPSKSDEEFRKVVNHVLALEAKLKSREREHQEIVDDLTIEITNGGGKVSADRAAMEWETANLQDKVIQLQEQVKYYIEENKKLVNLSNGEKGLDELAKFKGQLDAMQRAEMELSANHEEEINDINAKLVETAETYTKLSAEFPTIQSKVENIEEQLRKLAILSSSLTPAVPTPIDSHSEQPRLAPPNPRRLAPLLSVDDKGNRRVTEFEYQDDKQKGKYTGWLNKENLPNGHGILRVDNGDVYEGEWKCGQRHGMGVYVWFDGDFYSGPWEDGKRNGHGVFVYSDGRIYDGFYVRGIREGSGVFTWPYGAKYEGDYARDKRNGLGLHVYSDGRMYKGKYKDDRPHGHGTEYTKNGGILYEGIWQFGEFVGDDSASVAGSVFSAS